MHNQQFQTAAEDASQHIVQVCMERYGWELLDRAEFVRRVQALLAAETAMEPYQAAFQVYTPALYVACSGAEGRVRQERGYVELFAFLARHAARRYPEVHLDATQRALEAIYSTFARCHQPETFLAFALQKLRNAGRAEMRLARLNESTLCVSCEDTASVTATSNLMATDCDPLEQATATDFRTRLRTSVCVFLRRHPRSAQQFAVVWMKYIEGLDDHTIGERLGKSVACVHVLRSRAIAKLREDPDWQLLAREQGFYFRLAGAEPA